jgi:glycosyltransferase involved in cell wall biosynthesis
MEEKDKINLSVVLCTFNDEKYIKRAIQSILDQSYPYFEFIIVNDGSTDRTLDIIRSFVDVRIIVVNKANSGLPDSLNVGISMAKYDWIARMDGDDIALPDRFEKQVKVIREGIGVVGGQCSIIDENDEVYSKTRFATGYQMIRLGFKSGLSQIAHPSVLIRKSCLEEVGGYDTFFTAAQDYDLWYRISSKYKVVNISDVVQNLRKHSGSISQKKRSKQTEMNLVSLVKGALCILKPLTNDEYSKIIKLINEDKKIAWYRKPRRTFSNGLFHKLSHLFGLVRGLILTHYLESQRDSFRAQIINADLGLKSTRIVVNKIIK